MRIYSHHYNQISKQLLVLGILFTSVASLTIGLMASANYKDTGPAWATPSVSTIKLIGDASTDQDSADFDNNLDCDTISYRLSGSSTMQNGCFTETAYGMLDNDNDIAIFNGSSEGVKLYGYSGSQVLVAWPHAGATLALNNSSQDGQYASLYSNLSSNIVNQRDLTGHIVSRQLLSPADVPIKDTDGRTLLLNSSALTFSGNGAWMVAENLSGSFVRVNLSTLDVLPFAPSFGFVGSPGLKPSYISVSSDGRYVAIANDFAGSFRVYDLSTCSSATTSYKDCDSHDYWPLLSSQVSHPGYTSHVRFINDDLMSFRNDGKQYEMAPTATISSLTDYLGVGDSYTSGEGAFDYLSGTDDSNMCHLSSKSYPLLLTHDLFTSAGGHSVACSGAVIQDIGDTDGEYTGQMSNGLSSWQLQQNEPDFYNSVIGNYKPGYVAQQQFVEQYQPAIMTVSVGGDDIGFGDIVDRCVEPHLSGHLSSQTCYSTYESRLEVEQLIDKTESKLKALYKQLQTEDPGGHVYAIGYPQIASDTGNCAVNVHLSKSELEFSIELINYLNNSIQKAASQAGVSYVNISQALDGHKLCEVASYDVAVNGLTAGKDAGVLGVNVFGKESYHPTAFGQALIEEEILKQTNNLKQTPLVSSPASGDQSLTNAPVSGRSVNSLVPVPTMTSRLQSRGQNVTIKLSGSQVGLLANTVYITHLDGTNGTLLGTIMSDGQGNLNGSVGLPTDIDSGGHSIDIIGPGPTGQSVDVTQPITVANSPTDTDGDGIPNGNDSCPTIPNSGQDVDQDGIDDACDGYIGKPPTANNGSPSDPNDPTSPAMPTEPPDNPSGSSLTVRSIKAASTIREQHMIANVDGREVQHDKSLATSAPGLRLVTRKQSLILKQRWAYWILLLLLILGLLFWISGLDDRKLRAKRSWP